MKAADYGRILFGVSAVLFGMVSVLWHDSDMWQRLHPLPVPMAAVVAWILALAQVGGGIALPFRQTARWAAVVLGTVYGLFALVCVPAILRIPPDYGSIVNFFEQFSIVCGAIAVYVEAGGDAARSTMLSRIAGIGLGVCAVSFAHAQIYYFKYTASLVPTWIPPNQSFWTIATTIAFALVAIAILINRQARLATLLMALMLGLFGLLVWVPAIITAPKDPSNWSEIASNYLMTAAAWLVAGLFPLFTPRMRRLVDS
jgi:uncharacterized membrane protein YphA (DoxX/SURF4 family)